MQKILILILLVISSSLFSQENEVSDFEKIKIERLKRIRKEMTQFESKIYTHKQKLNSELDMVVKLKLESELLNFQREYDAKRLQFIETATGQQLNPVKIGNIEKKDLLQDIQELLGPALKGIKKASERPRMIQRLEEDLFEVSGRLETTIAAKVKLEELKENKEHSELKRSIKKSLQVVENSIRELKIQKEDIEFRLLKLKKQKGSVFSAISNMILDFFKTKGKNLLLSLISFIIIFWILKKGQSTFIRLIMGQINRKAENPTRNLWVMRPIRVVYSVMTLLLSLVFAIMTLYVLNDWVLVTFMIILIGALVWSSKQYLPMFFEQSKIVLNLGAIREGERVIFDGIPWKVQGLGYYCKLVNPALSGGFLRINTKELINSHSRPIISSEPWFPTKVNDWVELNDGTYGKIVMQSPDQVAIKLIGDAMKYYKISDFLALNPINLSNSFGVEVILGVDYGHQQIVLNEVIPTLKEKINLGLKEQFLNDSPHFIESSVDFYQAGASSLDIRYFIKCAGPLASKKMSIIRCIQHSFVSTCNEKGYIIPFNQLTVHMNK